MKLAIVGIVERGVPNKERLILSVVEDVDLAQYVVFDTAWLSDVNIATPPNAAYWFPTQKVKRGDTVVLYTGSGVSAEVPKGDGTTAHVHYWRRPKTLWNQPAGCATLVEINQWASTPKGSSA